MEGGERGREGKVKELEGETRWREGFGPPKNFGVAPPMEINSVGLPNLVHLKPQASIEAAVQTQN